MEKNGWIITKDPLFLNLTKQFKINIDLGCEKLLAAENATHKISAVSEFHRLVGGQFLNYRLALELLASERVLYLAVPADIYQDFFTDDFVQAVLQRYQIKVLVFNVQKQEITLWKD